LGFLMEMRYIWFGDGWFIYIYILKVTVVGKLQLINDEYTIQMMRNIVPLSRKYKTS
jgi:hypothetical protein